MNSWVWNGSAFDPCDAVPLSDRGFRYGMSLFESLRVQGGGAEHWEPHIQRLDAAAADRGFGAIAAALAATRGLLDQCGVDGFARIYVTAGDGPPAAPANAPRVFVFIESREAETADSCGLCIHEDTYHPPFRGLKTANYWFNCAALADARARGFGEALLFNDRSELVSACCANVFLVREGRITTPPRSSGCRAGVVREWVIARRKVTECRVGRDDVLRADEIFLTSSWAGVMPAATLEGRPLGPRSVGPGLAAEFRPAQKRNFD